MHIHPGNVDQYHARKIRVWLDGTEMDWVEEANEESGYLVVFIVSKDGSLIANPRDEIRKVKLFGRVDITLDGADLSSEKMLECANLYRVVKSHEALA